MSSVSNRLELSLGAERLAAGRDALAEPPEEAAPGRRLVRLRGRAVAADRLAVAEVEQLCPGRRHGAEPTRRGGVRLGLGQRRLARQAARDHLRRAVLHADAVEDVGGVHRPLLVGDDHELGAVGEAPDELQEAVDVGVVEGGLDLVEDVEGRRAGEEDAEDERQRDQRLLPAGEEREAPRRLAGRRHLDLDAGGLGRIAIVVLVLLGLGLAGVLRRRAPPASTEAGSAPPSTRSGRCASTSRSRPRPPGNMCSISSSKFSPAASNVSSKARSDLAIGLADQLRELVQRLLEVLALRLELGDVVLRLLVLALGERVDGTELLAAADQPLDRRLRPRPAPRRRAAPAPAPGRDRGSARIRSHSASASSRRSRSCAARTSASVTRSPMSRSSPWSSASTREHSRSSSGQLVAAPERRRPAPRRPRRGRRRRRGPQRGPSQSAGERRRQLRLGLDPLLERVLAAVAEHVLGPARRAGGALGAAADPGERLEPGADIAGLGCGGDRVARLRERRPCRLELPCERRLGVTLGGAQLGREGAERRATPLDGRAELGLAAGDRLGPGAEPLVGGAQRGQTRPRPRCARGRARRAAPRRRSGACSQHRSSPRSCRARRGPSRVAFSAAARSPPPADNRSPSRRSCSS